MYTKNNIIGKTDGWEKTNRLNILYYNVPTHGTWGET